MPTPPSIFVTLAATYTEVEAWVRKYGVNPKSIRHASSMQSVRGMHNFILIVFPSWSMGEGGRGERAAVGEYLFSKRPEIHLAETNIPILDSHGVIVDWRRNAHIETNFGAQRTSEKGPRSFSPGRKRP